MTNTGTRRLYKVTMDALSKLVTASLENPRGKSAYFSEAHEFSFEDEEGKRQIWLLPKGALVYRSNKKETEWLFQIITSDGGCVYVMPDGRVVPCATFTMEIKPRSPKKRPRRRRVSTPVTA